MIPHRDFQFFLRNAYFYFELATRDPGVGMLDDIGAGFIGCQLNSIDLLLRESDLARRSADELPDFIQVIKTCVKGGFAHLGS